MISFEPVTETHRRLLQDWLQQPHWREWWGESEAELAEIFAIEQGEHQPFIALNDGMPIAYIQCWKKAEHPDVSWVQDMTMTERGVDISIGDASHIGKGFGTSIVKAFAAKLFGEGVTRLVIDPNKFNARAVACYSKAGFHSFAEFDDHVLMEMRPQDLQGMENR